MKVSSHVNVHPGSLVILSGPPASGKTSFCQNNGIVPVSSDALRISLFGIRDGSPSNYDDGYVFEVITETLRRRLRHGLLTVIDTMALKDRDRNRFAKVADEDFQVPVKVLIFKEELQTCLLRNLSRQFQVPERVLIDKYDKLQTTSKWDYEFVTSDTKLVLEVPEFNLESVDLVGDVHGLGSDMDDLAVQMGYSRSDWVHPEGRKMVFLGDVVDRGPDSIPLLLKVMRTGHHLLLGNHERSLIRNIRGDLVKSRAAKSTYHDYLMLPERTQREISLFLLSLPKYAFGVHGNEKWILSHAQLKDYHPFETPTNDYVYGPKNYYKDDEFGKYLEEKEPHGVTGHIHGHIPSKENVENVISLDHRAGFGGPVTALRF